MASTKRWARAEAALRKAALKYPEATEDFPWGHTAIKVKGKCFLILGGTDEFLSVTVKLPLTGKEALGLSFASPTGYGLGKSSWVSAQFGQDDEIPVDMLQEWVDESYRAVAPKRLVAGLTSSSALAQPTQVGPAKSLRQRKKKRPAG
jgi:predicted DNA-binding protein (MmcQ/YjbR family)